MEMTGSSFIFNVHSRYHHALVILADLLIIFTSIFLLAYQSLTRNVLALSGCPFPSTLAIVSAIFNCGSGIVYLGLGFGTLGEKLRRGEPISPMNDWLVAVLQGLTWLLLVITLCLKRRLSCTLLLKLYMTLAILLAGFICITSVLEAVDSKHMPVQTVLNILAFPGAILLLSSAVQGCRFNEPSIHGREDGSCPPLQYGKEEADGRRTTPFDKAGCFSKLTFWWLNKLMNKGRKKPLEEKDLPGVRKVDKAQICYSKFLEISCKREQKASPHSPPILSTLFLWHWKETVITGILALVKVLATSACPLLILAIIQLSYGKQAFKHEGYVLTVALFLAKCIETVSERQWYLRMRLVGIQIRSVLCTTIFEKLLKHSAASQTTPGEIMSYVTADAYRIGEFPYWLHHAWTTILQLILAFLIIYYCVGLAAFVTLFLIVLSFGGNFPVAKLHQKFQIKFMKDQDKILQAFTEAVLAMKVLKLYAWETHFKNIIEGVRENQYKWLKGVQKLKNYYILLFWSYPIFAPIATFGACYIMKIPLNTSKVFTFLATIGLIQKPITIIPDVFGAFISAKVSLNRIMELIKAPQLLTQNSIRYNWNEHGSCIDMKASGISWDGNSHTIILRDIELMVKPGERVAICGEVGAGKTTLLAAILGEVPSINGMVSLSYAKLKDVEVQSITDVLITAAKITYSAIKPIMVQVCGKIAYVSQTPWIQTGTIQENILFGSTLDPCTYQDTLRICSLVEDLEMLPFGDLTVIGERGVNLSGGQKQRVQLARALYQNSDIYLLDDPFSAVDAHTAFHLFNECVQGALAEKTVLLVTHQVDLLHEFDSILLISDGRIMRASSFHELLVTSAEFRSLVNANDITASKSSSEVLLATKASEELKRVVTKEYLNASDQLIKEEEREIGDAGLKPYFQYLKHDKAFLFFSLSNFVQSLFILGQFAQSCLLAANLQDTSTIIKPIVIVAYAAIGCSMTIFLVSRTLLLYHLSLGASRSIFTMLLKSLFRAPMSFYDSTPLGRILSRVSSDLSIVDLDVPLKLSIALGSTMNVYFTFGVFVVIAWEVVFIIIPMIYMVRLLQGCYYASARELMRIEGTTKSLVASHFSETTAGAMTIRSFGEENQFFVKTLHLLDNNASASFHSFSANEWCILYLEIMYAVVLSASAFFMTMLPHKNNASGFVAMVLMYGLSVGSNFSFSVQSQCDLANMMVSVERLEQLIHIDSEASEIVEDNRPAPDWPYAGRVEICELKVRYRLNAPLVLRGISCVFEGGHKIGIVGRTGCGKTTLISTLFRLVEPTEGKIIVDGIDISRIGLHDLRSHFGVIPQEPILFHGSVRFDLDPLSEHSDKEIWEVLEKCQLKEAVQEKPESLDTLVLRDGSNWSMGQRQLFCLGRTLLKRRKILVLDEATASIDNATDLVIQRIIGVEFESSTVITVAHRIPTVMDCTKILALNDGELVEFDDPKKLMNEEGSLFAHLVREHCRSQKLNS